MRRRKLWITLWTSLGLILLAGLVALALLWSALRPGPWASSVALGPLQLQVSTPGLIRLLTDARLAPLLSARLAGRSWPGPGGRWSAHWQPAASGDGAWQLRCSPCLWTTRGQTVLRAASASLSLQRQGELLQGRWHIDHLQGDWQAELQGDTLQLHARLPPQPLREVLALWAGQIPELAQARIDGQLGLSLELQLPSRRWQLQPQAWGWSVDGLGTELLAHAHSQCQPATPPLPAHSPLVRAVLAAEDQRFYEHAGLDWVELPHAWQALQQPDQPLRGASTLSQQLAKLLLTGDERTLTRKLRELLYTLEMERTLGKARILQLYLAHAPWGVGLCGAEAAAQHYFGRPASQLDQAQAVWLAAMLHNPQHEATQWQRTGQINLPRALWVASQLRPLGPQRRQAVQQQLQAVRWAAPASH